MFWILLATISLIFVVPSHGEVYTSMANMEAMFQSEQSLLLPIKSYLKATEDNLNYLKTFLQQATKVHSSMNVSGVRKYLENPINVYKTVRRMSNQWMKLNEKMKQNAKETKDLIDTFENAKDTLPNDKDRQGVIDALFKLQNTYQIPSSTLIKGVIPGVAGVISQPLDMREIYEIGHDAYERRNFHSSRIWLRAALDFMGNSKSVSNIQKTSILEQLADSEFKQRNVTEAYRLTQELSELRPNDKEVLKRLGKFEVEIKLQEAFAEDEFVNSEAIRKPEEKLFAPQLSHDRLCRGNVKQLTKEEMRVMICWYETKHPVLKLKPQKVERIWATPEIFRFHDILTDPQVSMVKENAYPLLKRSTVQNNDGTARTTHARIGKTAYLAWTEYGFLKTMLMRAQGVTGLDMGYTKRLSVTNYGVGGNYSPHHDYVSVNPDVHADFVGFGNRIATLMFYLSDVEAGGATVFLQGETAVFPKKRDAVFWYNLKRNGEGDHMTLHCGCPVLVGHKWIANWWIYERGQVFRRPCLLDKNL